MSLHTIPAVIRHQSAHRQDAIAILGLGREPLSYAQLAGHVDQIVTQLHTCGIGRSCRVGLVIPQGPELATAFLSVASCATAVPLNPALRLDEYRSYLPLLSVDCLIIQSDLETEARTAARECGIPILDLTVDPTEAAGIFRLSGDVHLAFGDMTESQPDDIAVVMMSSGTTSRPKIIPISQRISISSSDHQARTLGFTSEDRLLSVVSLFFAGGLYDFVRQMVAGGSAAITPGFDAACFFDWLHHFQPTFCTATASMYQSALAQIALNPDIVKGHSLRYLRATSMALPAELMQAIEAAFNVPIVQLYGSTETGLLTINPLPPRIRKPGSVGPAVDGDVAIFDADDNQLSANQIGEIRARGPHIFQGYEGDPDLTRESFIDGWFRTGDQGYLDDDGYLFVTGRVKELISRGGEKISPVELETVLIACPGVAEIAAFAVPDPHQGEEIGVAIVAKSGVTLSEKEIRAFAAERLKPTKIPRYVLFLPTLPRTTLGKVKRLALANMLKIQQIEAQAQVSDPAYIAPNTDPERRLVAIWAELLRCDPDSISLNTQFRDLGGDSLAAARLIFRVREAFGVMVTVVDFFDAATISAQARVIADLLAGGGAGRHASTLVPIRLEGNRNPLFCLHALNGGTYFYERLIPLLHPDQPIYGLQAVGFDGSEAPLTSVMEIAIRQTREIRAVQSHGPYYLCGYSLGGRLALECARILRDQHGQDAYVCMIDDRLHISAPGLAYKHSGKRGLSRILRQVRTLSYALLRLPSPYRSAYLRQTIAQSTQNRAQAQERMRLRQEAFEGENQELPSEILNVRQTNMRAAKDYSPRPYSGPVTYLRTDNGISVPFFRMWEVISKGDARMIEIPGHHNQIMASPYVETVAKHLQDWLDRYQGRTKGE